MNKKVRKNLLVLFFMAYLTVGFVFIIKSRNIDGVFPDVLNNLELNPTASTNPSSPETLGAAVVTEDYAIEHQNYYYDTASKSAGVYVIIGLWDFVGINNFDLFLYTDSAYSSLVASSTDTAYVDWVAYRTSQVGPVYPKVYTTTGAGTGYIFHRTLYQFSFPQWLCDIFYSAPFDAIIVLLDDSKCYNFELEVDMGTTADLYLFRLDPGSSIPKDMHTLTSVTVIDDMTVKPATTDYYLLVSIRTSETGSADLTIRSVDCPIPGFELPLIAMALAAIILFAKNIFKTSPKII
jgi:hypothetical protein